ncbi:MAG: hypothetical protein AAF989_00310 [Planctomycetota bacterium]
MGDNGGLPGLSLEWQVLGRWPKRPGFTDQPVSGGRLPLGRMTGLPVSVFLLVELFMQLNRVCGAIAVSLCLASNVFSHPGHGLVEHGPLHEATTVEHGLPVLGMILGSAIVVTLVQYFRSNRSSLAFRRNDAK